MKKGFTLIELMIVITIIGLLSAIALPRFTDSTKDAKVAQVQGNLSNLRTAVGVYYVSEDRYPVYGELEQGGDISEGGSLSQLFSEFYSKSEMPETAATENIVEGNRVEDERNNQGGWLYLEEKGEVYANLPDGAYTGDTAEEIWVESNFTGEDPDTPTEPEEFKEITGEKLNNFDKVDGVLGITYGNDGLSYDSENKFLEVSPFRGGVLEFNKKISEISIVASYREEEDGWRITDNSDGTYTYEMKLDPPSNKVEFPNPSFGELWSGKNYISKILHK